MRLHATILFPKEANQKGSVAENRERGFFRGWRETFPLDLASKRLWKLSGLGLYGCLGTGFLGLSAHLCLRSSPVCGWWGVDPGETVRARISPLPREGTRDHSLGVSAPPPKGLGFSLSLNSANKTSTEAQGEADGSAAWPFRSASRADSVEAPAERPGGGRHLCPTTAAARGPSERPCAETW